MKKREAFILDIVCRYALMILVGVVGVRIFYFFFTYLTLHLSYFLLKLFFDVSIISNIIIVNNFPIEIIGACVAGSAYYLLLILNLSTREIKIKKRIWMLLFSFALFLVVNLLRIFVLSILYVNGVSFFDIAHRAFWYAGSVIFVVGIWFLTVRVFKVKEIPFYSDIVCFFETFNLEPEIALRKNPKTKKPKRHKKH